MTDTPKWRLETREDIDGGTYKAWTDEPMPAILRGAEELRSLYLADQTQPVSYFVETVQVAAGAVLDVEEMTRVLLPHDLIRSPHLGAHCACGEDETAGGGYLHAQHLATVLRASILGDEA